MSDQPLERPCAQCGVSNSADNARCWLCGAPLLEPAPPDVVEAELVSPQESQPPERRPQGPPPFAGQPAPSTFSLTTLLIILTLFAVFFGLLREAPGLAIPVLFTVAPALALTYRDMNRRRARGEEVTIGQRIARFLVSVMMVWAIGFAAILAIIAALWAVCVAIFGLNMFR